ncbi:hypothetical protein DCS32_15385 [Dokdonia sp. Dokd-P16]|nr:hypothetical protein DCS32_15385 [Dokdonia sp. Dokd-P16]
MKLSRNEGKCAERIININLSLLVGLKADLISKMEIENGTLQLCSEQAFLPFSGRFSAMAIGIFDIVSKTLK